MKRTLFLLALFGSTPFIRTANFNRHGTRPHCSGRAALPLVVGFFLLLPLCGHGQQTNAGIAFEATKAKAENGDVAAQNAIGVRYATGDGVGQSFFEAARWFRRAAEQGDATAQYHLALYYYDGGRIDYQQATIWYRKAAEQGLAKAQNKLGVMYDEGRGVSENLDEAIKWFQLAAKQDNTAAKTNLLKTLERKAAKDYWKHAKQRQVDSGTTLSSFQYQGTRPLPAVQSTNEIKMSSGITYRGVTVRKLEFDGVVIDYLPKEGGVGMAKIKFDDLPEDVQRQYPGQIRAMQVQKALQQADAKRIADQEAENLSTLSQIASDYNKSHTYFGADIFACVDMACDVWNMVVTKGMKAQLFVGNVNKDIKSFSEANHAWVLAEISPGNWIAVEATGGFLVKKTENQRYFVGFPFSTPRELQDYQARLYNAHR